ncbi:MAG: outer membrane protein assembly factor BamB family protein [Thermoanaerobaculia bacterium]
MRTLLLLALLTTTAAHADPIEGRWYGAVGFPEIDRIDIGFEFKPNAAHELKAYLYEPVLNFYGLELPGVMKANGSQYELAEYGLSFTLHDDKLDGTMSGLKAPMSLARTQSLPSEVPVPDLPKGPGPLWQVKLAAPIYAAAAIRDGVAYVGTTGGVFHAVNTKDGTVAWTFNAGRPMYGQALATDDGVYFVCDNGYLFKLARKTGKEIWRYDLGDSRVDRVLPHPTVYEYDFKAPQPVTADGAIYVGSGDGSFHAVDATSGRRIWRFAPPAKKSSVIVGGTEQTEVGKVRTDAVVDGGNVIFGSFDGSLYAVDRKSGKQVWTKDTKARVDASPALIDGKLIGGNFGSLLFALNPKDGTVLWRLLWWGSAVESTATPYGDRAYIGASDLRRITCFDPKTGHVYWRTDVYGWPWGRPAVTENFVYIGAAAATPYDMRHLPSMTALRRDTGAIAWRYPLPESGFAYGLAASPAIEGKTLVIGSLDGTLYAFPAM